MKYSALPCKELLPSMLRKKIGKYFLLFFVGMFVAVLQMHATPNKNKITIIRSRISLKEFFKEIQQQTGYTVMALLASFNACKKDNYAPPNLTFSGRVTYQGTPLGLKNNGGGTVYFELWQSGFGSTGAIQVFFDQDGSFSSQLFSGNYKMVIPVSQGPFMSIPDKTTNSDTTLLTLSSNKTMDIEVLPYYMFSNSSFKLNADSTVQASCSISQIITDANAKSIEYVALFVNRTSFVDDDNQIVQAKIKGSDLTGLVNISFTTKIPTNIANGNVGVPNQNYFFARIGLKISGKDDMLFTDVQKLTF